MKPIPFVAFLAGCLLVALSPARALEIEDIAGNTVTLEKPAERVLLGEGRFFIALSLLHPEDPVARVAGMLNEFQKYDPATYQRYLDVYPGLAEVPRFGATTEASVSLERAIVLKPDAAIFGLSGHGPQETSTVMIDALEAAGIPVIFIDFRDDPLGHTAESMRILGKALGLEETADAFAATYEAEIAKVTGRIAELEGARPSVLIEARVGLGDGCCFTIARGMFAGMVEAAGGDNIAAGVLPGVAGTIDLEYVIEKQPEIYIGTAIGALEGPMSAPGRIVLGPGVPEEAARESLEIALDRPGIGTLKAVEDGRAYGIWHHFYNSPMNAYAFQTIAGWLHPELFADLEPEALLEALLADTAPVDLDGTYAVGIESEAAR